jgi:threonine 3-dehydrogenase
MKALVKDKAEPGIWLKEVPRPHIGPNDVLIKISKTAICGTDIHIFDWDSWAQEHVPIGLITGHEFVGKVVEVGEEVSGFYIGDRVSGEGHIACGFCRNCRAGRRHVCRKNVSVGVTRTGCFAEYFVLPAVNAYPIPKDIPDIEAAILDPLGNAAHTALSFDLIGEDVLITGAGPVGMMAAAIARYAGARHVVVTDVNPYRLELVKKMGVSVAVDTNQKSLDVVMKELEMREGFDVGLEMSGNSFAFNDMLTHMNHGGKVALLGFLPQSTQINWNNIIMKGLNVKGIYGREMFETWYKMICMLQGGLNISPAITHEFPIDEYEQAFAMMKSGKSGKVVLNWQ